MRQIKQLPFVKLAVNTLAHGGAQAGLNYLKASQQHGYILYTRMKTLHDDNTDLTGSPLLNALQTALKGYIAGDEVNDIHQIRNSWTALANIDAQPQTVLQLVQKIGGDVAGNIAATSVVTALKVLGIFDKIPVNENIVGAVVGAATDIGISCAVKFNFTDLFQIAAAGFIGASNGYNTAGILKGIDFSTHDEIDPANPIVTPTYNNDDSGEL
jgi:hypothetical protein